MIRLSYGALGELFTLRVVAWALLTAVVCAIILITVALIRRAKTHTTPPSHWDWLKDFIVPMITPVAVVGLGFWFTFLSNRQQQQERQESALRDLMVSQDRADTSLLLAVDLKLHTHLQRYLAGREKHTDTEFDEEACFFFYSIHRAIMINLAATEGNLVFPRIWLEEAFENLAETVVVRIRGAEDEDPSTSAEGEAVTYQYFGGYALGRSTDRSLPSLFAFHWLLHGVNITSHQFSAIEAEALQREYQIFRGRLRTDQFNVHEVMKDLQAMRALSTYAYNNSFAEWYGVEREPFEVKASRKPPQNFVPSWDIKDRETTWQLIREFVPKRYRH